MTEYFFQKDTTLVKEDRTVVGWQELAVGGGCDSPGEPKEILGVIELTWLIVLVGTSICKCVQFLELYTKK